MARVNGIHAQVILGAKANEHGSAIGRTRPSILYCGEVALADQVVAAQTVKAALSALQVGSCFSGISLRPSATALGDVPYVEAARFDDWPEANQNREARLLLADASGKITTTLSIPYLADGSTDVSVAAAVVALLADKIFLHNGVSADAPRLTQVLRSVITSR